jgi:Flp pilus assembly pilin Flp
MKTKLGKRFAAQGMVEYALVLVLIAIASLLILQLSGVSIRDVYCRVAAGLGANACGQTAYCQDNFANLGGWKVSAGPASGWVISNGQLCASGNGTIANKCSMSGMPSNDYTAEIVSAKLNTGNGYGLFFRSFDNGLGMSGYAFQYDPGLSGVVIRKWVNGAEINPALAYKSMPGTDWYGAAHNLSVKVVGDTFIGMVDGVPVLTAKDSTYPSGGTGLRVWDSTQVCMNNFGVNPIAP